jgi:hypothetical protein
MKRILIFSIMAYFVITFTPNHLHAQINIRQTADSVVQILSIINDDNSATGTGTIVSANGLIYTNSHVVEDGQLFFVALLEDVQELPIYEYEAALIYMSETLDFAVLQILWDIDGNPINPDELNLPYLTPSLEPVDIGTELHIFGYPSLADGYLTVTAGQIVAIQNGTIADQRLPVLYRTDSEISGGNSGGLAITTDGRYIGLPTWVFWKEDDETRGKLGGIVPIIAVHTELVEMGILNHINEPVVGYKQFVNEIPSMPTMNQPLVSWKFVNDSPAMICYMYISPVTSSRWGEDKLANNIIFAGQTFVFQVLSGEYDILIHDCSDNELADIRGVTIDVNHGNFIFNPLGNLTTQSTQATISDNVFITLACGDQVYTNTVEVYFGNLAPNRQYEVMVFGVGSFTPVLAIEDATTGQVYCVEEHDPLGRVTLTLPSSGVVKPDPTRSTMNISVTPEDEANGFSVYVASPAGETGEFVVMIDGLALDSNRNPIDFYSVSLTPSLINSGVPITVYMMGVATQTDPILYLADPTTYDVLVLNGDIPVSCDDAGSDNCFGGNTDLFAGGLMIDGVNIPFRFTDAMLTLPLDDLNPNPVELLYFNIAATSYLDSSNSEYRIFFHLSNAGVSH